MKEAELKELLKSIYLKKLNYLCRMLVNEFGAYYECSKYNRKTSLGPIQDHCLSETETERGQNAFSYALKVKFPELEVEIEEVLYEDDTFE